MAWTFADVTFVLAIAAIPFICVFLGSRSRNPRQTKVSSVMHWSGLNEDKLRGAERELISLLAAHCGVPKSDVKVKIAGGVPTCPTCSNVRRWLLFGAQNERVSLRTFSLKTILQALLWCE